MLLIPLTMFWLFHNGDAVIYSLNKTEALRMPPVFHLDKYDQCLYENDATGVYCYAKFDLVTDEPSELYQMIREYSEREETRFNHTQLSYGICLTKTCNHLYKLDTTGDQKLVLEACLNESLWKDYKLKAKINHEFLCTTASDKPGIDLLDHIVAFVLFTIIGLNIIESFREIYYGADKCPQGKDFLSCFSISHNWAKLTAPSGGPDPLLSKLQFLQGYKCLITTAVTVAHLFYPVTINTSKAYESESIFSTFYLALISNGPIIMQGFFGISGFLLAYNFELLAEKGRVTPAWIPVAIFYRWVKLIAPYVMVLAFCATWMRHSGSGPLWQAEVVREVESCRRNWWKNLLFINNYLDDAPPSVSCIPSSWYLPTDLQLYTLGVLVLILTSGFLRMFIVGFMIIIGLCSVGFHTYSNDLDPSLWMKPEYGRNLFLQSPVFDHVYKRAHTNLGGYFAGIASGLAAYRLAKTGFNLQKYVRHRYLGLLHKIGILLFVYLHSYLYPIGPRYSVLTRTTLAVLSKVASIFLFSSSTICLTLLVNDIEKDFMTWWGWTVPSRLVFSVYLVHLIIIKFFGASKHDLAYAAARHIWEMIIGNFVIIFIGGLVFHLLFEAPFNQLIKMYILPTKDDNERVKRNQESEESVDKINNFVTEAKQVTRCKGD